MEQLYFDAPSYRFKMKATTIQEIQAMILLDTLLYQYCGDAVIARRRPSVVKFRQTENKRSFSEECILSVDPKEKQQTSYRRDMRYISHCPQKLRQNYENLEVFEDMCAHPIHRRKDIQFKFAGANPVPKDGLRKKVLDKTHVQFLSISSQQSQTFFPQQYLIVGSMRRDGFKRPTRPYSSSYSSYSLSNVL